MRVNSEIAYSLKNKHMYNYERMRNHNFNSLWLVASPSFIFSCCIQIDTCLLSLLLLRCVFIPSFCIQFAFGFFSHENAYVYLMLSSDLFEHRHRRIILLLVLPCYQFIEKNHSHYWLVLDVKYQMITANSEHCSATFVFYKLCYFHCCKWKSFMCW